MLKTIKDGLLMVALSMFALQLSGCGRVNDQPDLGQVTGTVALDGAPLKGIEVVFYPDSGRPARGKTYADGKYELRYIREVFGTKVGHNRVEIAPSEEGEEDSEGDDSSENDNAKQTRKRGKVKIPARYNTETVLEADVQPYENVFDFKLESKPPA
jgi:hypothetical protein